MRLPPSPPNPELEALLKRSAEIVAAMTPAQKAEMVLRQRISWVRGEMGLSNPDWSDEKLAILIDALPEAWALSEIDRLRSAISLTIQESGHLADGDNCTLIHLKRAIAA